MKKLLVFTILCLLSSNFIRGQGIKMKTQFISSKIGDKEWTEWEKFETIAVINNDKLIIYSEPKETYYVTSKNEPEANTEIILSLNCIDKEGEECLIDIVVGETNQMFISYPNAILAIAFKPLE